jgi:hypothetical protein
MGVVHSVDTCSSANEWKKDELFRTPSNQELVEYDEMEQQATRKHNQQQQQQQKQQQRQQQQQQKLPRAIPDANRSVQRQLGVFVEQGHQSHHQHQPKQKYHPSPCNSPVTSPSSRRSQYQHQHHHHYKEEEEDDDVDHHENDNHHGHTRISSTWTKVKQKSVRRIRQASISMVDKVSYAAGAVSHSSKKFFQHHHQESPHHTNTNNNNNNNNNSPRNSRHKRQNSNSHQGRRMFFFTSTTTTTTPKTVLPKVRGGVWLRGCCSDEEHKQKAKDIVELLRPLHGAKALEAYGLEYRTVRLDQPLLLPLLPTLGYVKGQPLNNNKDQPFDVPEIENHVPILVKEDDEDEEQEARDNPVQSLNSLGDKLPETASVDISVVSDATDNHDKTKDVDDDGSFHHCACQTEDSKPLSDTNNNDGSTCTCKCKQAATKMTRLFHKESNTMITMKNRKEFIADGDMYDAIARVTQEYAQEVMAKDGDLEWVTICEAGNNPEPIRALVSRRLVQDESRLDHEPTLLIATGKGKVRAGVFSRQHLLLSGLECSTAVPIVREAHKRNMLMVLVDPNVHGDRMGMMTFEKSMERMFRRWESNHDIGTNNKGAAPPPPLTQKDLFVLSHSQSGAQLTRYLLDKSDYYIPHLRAVAFTDSTHNIQWAKSKNLDRLKEFLESDDCLYFRCAKNTCNDPLLKPLSSLGDVVETDEFWKHRFGNIRTVCAGTSEHSLTNWFARCHIWEHFDKHLVPWSNKNTNDTTTTTPIDPTPEGCFVASSLVPS